MGGARAVVGAALAAAIGLAPAAAAAGAAAGEPARVASPRDLLDRAGALLAEASAAREPPRRPPTPIAVKWKARRVDSYDLGAPLLALTSGDLDGDGRAELIAVTERAVVVLAPAGRRAIAETARRALPAEAADVEPRDAVATAVVARTGRGAEVWARASTAARGVRLVLVDGALRDAAGGADAAEGSDAYWLCADRAAALVPGRNHFARGDGVPAAWPARLWAARCAPDLVDPEGRAMRVDAVLGDGGALTVTISTRCAAGEAACIAERAVALPGVGTAFAVADVDRDGRAEVITAAASAPGDPDTVTVHALPAAGGEPGKPVFTRGFTGGVGGIAADDVDGDGDVEVFAAVRLAGSSRVDLWLLD